MLNAHTSSNLCIWQHIDSRFPSQLTSSRRPNERNSSQHEPKSAEGQRGIDWCHQDQSSTFGWAPISTCFGTRIWCHLCIESSGSWTGSSSPGGCNSLGVRGFEEWRTCHEKTLFGHGGVLGEAWCGYYWRLGFGLGSSFGASLTNTYRRHQGFRRYFQLGSGTFTCNASEGFERCCKRC